MTDAATDSTSFVDTALKSSGPAWMPGLAGPVAHAARAALKLAIGLSTADYGTARMLAGNAGAERDEAHRIHLGPVFAANGPIVLETLRPGIAARYVDLGLILADSVTSASCVPHLECALDRLATIPDIARAIGALVSVLHVTVPEGPDYDVSFSDPILPFSIFVGVAGDSGRHAELRLAEGILHECMHLQLTLVEAAIPLVSDIDERHHSPWKGTARPVQGILHGIYVFAAIRDFMTTILEQGSVKAHERAYVAKRIHTCAAEIAEATRPILAGRGLTEAGRNLVHRLA